MSQDKSLLLTLFCSTRLFQCLHSASLLCRSPRRRLMSCCMAILSPKSCSSPPQLILSNPGTEHQFYIMQNIPPFRTKSKIKLYFSRQQNKTDEYVSSKPIYTYMQIVVSRQKWIEIFFNIYSMYRRKLNTQKILPFVKSQNQRQNTTINNIFRRTKLIPRL